MSGCVRGRPDHGKVFGLALLLALGGCDIGSSSAEAAPTTSELRGLPADAQLVGVAITPNGTRYVLDQRSGLYRIDAAGAVLVFNTTGLDRPGVHRHRRARRRSLRPHRRERRLLVRSEHGQPVELFLLSPFSAPRQGQTGMALRSPSLPSA